MTDTQPAVPRPLFGNINVVLATIGTAATILTSVLSGWAAFNSSRAETAAKSAKADLELILAQRKQDNEETKSNRDFQVVVFDKAYTALGQDKPALQRAALALVYGLEDSEMRRNLINSFGAAGATDEVRQDALNSAAKEGQFNQQATLDAQAAAAGKGVVAKAAEGTQILASNTQGYNVDVFWCSGSSDSEANRSRADRVGALLAQAAERRETVANVRIGRVRVREMPATTNLRPGYRITNDIVAHDPGAEGQVAEAIAGRIRSAGLETFTASQRYGKTDSYLSVFACKSPATV